MQGEIMPFDIFNTRFGTSADALLVYNTLYNGIKPHEELFLRQLSDPSEVETTQMLFRDIPCGSINRKVLYETIIDSTTESVREEWRMMYDIEEGDADVWCMSHECCSETKLLYLHWRILLNIFATGVLKKKMKKINDDRCDYCGEVDTLIHFFFKCEVSVIVWNEADNLISSIVGKKVTLTEQNKMFGILTQDCTYHNNLRMYINHIILVCKYTISKFKYDKFGDIRILLENQLRYRELDIYSME